MKNPCVYILTNKNHTALYVGVTSHLLQRVQRHREKFYGNSFTARYNIHKLVYYEEFNSMLDAIAREKQLKGGSRKQKVALVNRFNPTWRDLSETLQQKRG